MTTETPLPFSWKIALNRLEEANLVSWVLSREDKGDREGIPHIYPIP